MARRKKVNANERWFAEAERVPHADSVDVKQVRTSVKRWRAAVWAVMAMSVLLVASTMALLFDGGQEVAPATTVQVSQPGMQEARMAVSDWVASPDSPLPGGHVVSWDGAEATPWVNDDENPGYDVYVHTFSLASADQSVMYEAQIRTAVSASEGVNVVGEPSLIPLPGAAQFASGSKWPGLVSLSAPAGVSDAVASWVKAYVSGDSVALRLAVGDQDATHGYVPLSGIASAQVAITDSAQPAAADGTETSGSQIVVAATVIFSRLGPIDDDDSAATFDLDLLVVDANTAAPRVVAWSGPGLGQTLVPFQNAVPAERVSTDVEELDGPVASAEPAAPGVSPTPAAPVTDPTKEGN